MTMSKKKDKGGKGEAGGAKIPKHIAGFKLPKDVRRTGEALIAQAKSPAGQAAIAKGLTLAAGLATAAAERSARAKGLTPKPGESGEGTAPPPAAPLDPAKVAEAVGTVADAVLGRLFPKR